MSGGGGEGHKEAPAGKPAHGAPAKDPYVDLAERIFVNLSARVYGTLSGTEQKKPDPKALAAFCFKLADAFEQATKETDRMKSRIEAENKAKVNLADVDLSSVIAGSAKP
jgi:hypothetical protein